MLRSKDIRQALRALGCALGVAGIVGTGSPVALADGTPTNVELPALEQPSTVVADDSQSDATTAKATEGARVKGVDHYFAWAGEGEGDDTEGAVDKVESVDVARVIGEDGDTVYVELRKNGKIQASHMAFTLGADTAAEENGEMVGLISIANFNYDREATYTLKVFNDRSQKEKIFEGTIVPVYATYDGRETLIAVRTIAEGETREFVAPSTINEGNAVYARTKAEPVSDDPLTYEYAITDGVEAPVKVTYVDDEGNVLKEEDLGTLAAGNSKKIDVPQLLKVEGEDGTVSFYRTVSFNETLTATFPGTSEFTVTCKTLSAQSGSVADSSSYYVATINLVNEEGKKLATDTLDVTSSYLYTPPARLHITAANGGVDTYVLSDENENLNSSKVLALAPTTEGVVDGRKSFDINYTKLGEDAELAWTIKIVNGKADPKDKDRIIDTVVKTVAPGQTETFVPEKSIKIGDTEYVPVSSTKESYSYTHGQIPAKNEESVYPTLTIYYVPDGWEAKEPYDITIRYVNIANREVIKTETMTARPEDRDNLEITSPESFTEGGIEYVRLAGQERSIFHSYYSSARAYTIYYRDINDDLSADITISNIEVEYVDGEETVTDGGTREINDGTTYTDGGTTTTDGGTTYTDGGTTTTDNGTTTTDGGTTTTDGGTTYVDGGTTTTTNAGTGTTTNNGTTNAGTTNTGTTNTGTTNLGTTNRGTTNYGTTNAGTADNGTANFGTADAGTTGAGTQDAAQPSTQNATRASIPEGQNLSVVNGDGNSLITDGEGRDTNTMRIEDNETPLAGPSSSTPGAENAAAASSRIGLITGASLAALAALGLLFYIFFKRRKEEEENVEEATEE